MDNEKKTTGKKQPEVKKTVPDFGVEAKPSRKPSILLLTIALLTVAIVVMGYLLLKGGKSESVPVDSKVEQMNQLVNKIRDLETSVQGRQQEIAALMGEYKKRTGRDLPAMSFMDLSEDEKQLMEDLIKNEKDVSVKTLLNELLSYRNEISELREEIENLEELLPKPHTVVKGENHYQISMNYLLNEQNVEKDTAAKLIERCALFEPLVPGFKVWHFYSGGQYGTFVTQGDATISPNTMRRIAKKKLVDARDEAISERDKLAGDIKTLEEKRAQLISQLELLNQEKQSLITSIRKIKTENSELVKTVNSLHFVMDNKNNLKKRGILKGGFLRALRISKVKSETFNMALDLRTASVITVPSEEMGLTKIRSITIYPKFYKKDTDYSINIGKDEKTAEIKLLNREKFLGNKIVISVK